MNELVEIYGEGTVLAVGGGAIGLLFGFFAQRSRFCLRAAVIDFWHGQFKDKLSIWLLAFSAAVIATQAFVLWGGLDSSAARQIAARGSLSGAIVGGLMFGIGMILTRGCASRLLILSANGNLRALLSGLIFAVIAQSSLSGALMPARIAVSEWATLEGGPGRDLLAMSGTSHVTGLVIG
ncbi:MAG: YeeE/YedE thiosulfate transporter family protein, partial [Limnohabitans sp.]